jgi:hypothetical protein
MWGNQNNAESSLASMGVVDDELEYYSTIMRWQVALKHDGGKIIKGNKMICMQKSLQEVKSKERRQFM